MSLVCVRVRVGAEHYAFRVSEVLEVADLAEVTVVPGAPDGVLGVSKLRGHILPIIDLGAVVGVPRGGDSHRVVVLEQHGHQLGLAVDELEEVGELHAPSEQPDSPYLEGAALVDGKLVGLIDTGAVMAFAGAEEDA